MKLRLVLAVAGLSFFSVVVNAQKNNAGTHHYLYVATPGIRDYLGYAGHGILVYDIDNGHKFVKRVETQGLHLKVIKIWSS